MRISRSTLTTVVSLTLFIGGIFLIFFAGGFWGYFLGIPAVQIGIVFIIFTFEKLSNESISEDIEQQKEEFKKMKR